MKLVGIMILFMSCSTYGFVIDRYDYQRLKELEKFIYALTLLKAEIDYRLTPLKEAMLYVSQFTTPAIRKVFEAFANALGERDSVDLNKMWQESLKSNYSAFHLYPRDYQMLHELSQGCGDLDKNMQKKNIDLLVEKLNHELIRATEEYQKRTKLNKYLGILIGACISIFLI